MSVYISVFTAKGGVGKTVMAAHIAGVLKLFGHDVVLVDADPQRNLYGAVGQLMTVHTDKHDNQVVQVFTDDEVDKQFRKMRVKPQFVVVDCSPSPSTGDATEHFLKQSDICISPITLSPLGVGRNGTRITDTLKYIRRCSKSTQAFIVVNKSPPKLTHAATSALNTARTAVKAARTVAKDTNLRFLDPDQDTIQIRESGMLGRFGDGSPLFPAGIAGRYPKEDFTSLVAYLLDKGSLSQQHHEELETV